MALVRNGTIASLRTDNMMMEDSDSMSMSQRRRNSRRQLEVFEISDTEKTAYRSVYLPIVRDSLPRALEVFDFAEPGMVVGKRETSNTPTQGLYLLNNDFVMRQSKAFAQRLMDESDSTKSRIQLAFLRAYGREATDEEIQSAMSFYREYDVTQKQRSRRRFRDRGNNEETLKLERLSALTHAILASAEFRYTN